MPTLIDIRMPDLQEGTESVVAAWLKKSGDRVKIHEPLIEINTDKAIMEVAAPASGVLLDILKPSDQAIHPGDVLGRIQAISEAAAETSRDAAPPSFRPRRSPTRRAWARASLPDRAVRSAGRGFAACA